MAHLITRSISIDAGHRIMTHGSKCAHIHGHRYTIEASCCAKGDRLHESGVQTDMVLDFGFLKDVMCQQIDMPCDHGFIASIEDTGVLRMFAPESQDFDSWLEAARSGLASDKYFSTTDCTLGNKLYIIAAHPTAERLAEHWYQRLLKPVEERSDGLATLTKVRVWETPNCWAEYTQ